MATADDDVLIGFDWGRAQHYVLAERPDGRRLCAEYLPHDGEAWRAFGARVLAWCGGDAARVRVALELAEGSVVTQFLALGAQVFTLSPVRSAALRRSGQGSDAKDDARDAAVLVRALARMPESLVRVHPRDPAQAELRAACVVRERLLADRHPYVLLIQNRLSEYFPALLRVAADAFHRPWFAALFALVPTPAAAHAVRPSRCAVVLRRALCRQDPRVVLTALRAPALLVAPAVVDTLVRDIQGALRHVQFLAPELAAAKRRVAEARLAWCGADPALRDQRERDLRVLRSLPGVGDFVEAALIAEAAEALHQRDLRALRVYAGVAAVTVQSGASRRVRMRRSSSERLRDALYHWARVAVLHDPVCKAQYDRLRAAGKTFARALRGVGDRLLALACTLLARGEMFDPARRIAAPVKVVAATPTATAIVTATA